MAEENSSGNEREEERTEHMKQHNISGRSDAINNDAIEDYVNLYLDVFDN